MNGLDDCVRALVGRGVSLYANSEKKLSLSIKRSNVQAREIQPLRDNKYFILNLLPVGFEVSMAHFENALEYYREREAMLVYGGMDEGTAGLKAMPDTRAFLLSLLA